MISIKVLKNSLRFERSDLRPPPQLLNASALFKSISLQTIWSPNSTSYEWAFSISFIFSVKIF